MHQKNLGREIGGICKVGELIGVHVVGRGVERHKFKTC